MSKISNASSAEIAKPAPAPRRNMIIIHGEKGGVGKSFCAALAGSESIRLGRKLLVAETDSSVPDVAPRFRASQNCSVFMMPIDRSAESAEALSTLLTEIESYARGLHLPDTILINAPAGASNVLDNFAPIFEQAAADLDYDLTIGFMIDNSSAVLPRITDSLALGLLSLKQARRAVIYTSWLGASAEFPFSKSPIRASAIDLGIAELEFPGLVPASLLELVKRSNKPFFDMLDKESGLKIVERAMLARWLKSCEPLARWLVNSIGDRDE